MGYVFGQFEQVMVCSMDERILPMNQQKATMTYTSIKSQHNQHFFWSTIRQGPQTLIIFDPPGIASQSSSTPRQVIPVLAQDAIEILSNLLDIGCNFRPWFFTLSGRDKAASVLRYEAF